MDELRIELDSVRKYRNKHEWRPVNRASCGDASVTGDGEMTIAEWIEIERLRRVTPEQQEADVLTRRAICARINWLSGLDLARVAQTAGIEPTGIYAPKNTSEDAGRPYGAWLDEETEMTKEQYLAWADTAKFGSHRPWRVVEKNEDGPENG